MKRRNFEPEAAPIVEEPEDVLEPEFDEDLDAEIGALVERAEDPGLGASREGVVRHGRAGQALSQSDMDRITHDTARALAAQRKVRAYIPLDPRIQDPQFQAETVCVNGYVMQITRGEWVLVPKTVGEILREAGYPVNFEEA